MELTPRDLALIIWSNTHGEWSKEMAIHWLEGFIELIREEAVRGAEELLRKSMIARALEGLKQVDSLTPSHDAQEAKDRLTRSYGDIEADVNSP